MSIITNKIETSSRDKVYDSVKKCLNMCLPSFEPNYNRLLPVRQILWSSITAQINEINNMSNHYFKLKIGDKNR